MFSSELTSSYRRFHHSKFIITALQLTLLFSIIFRDRPGFRISPLFSITHWDRFFALVFSISYWEVPSFLTSFLFLPFIFNNLLGGSPSPLSSLTYWWQFSLFIAPLACGLSAIEDAVRGVRNVAGQASGHRGTNQYTKYIT